MGKSRNLFFIFIPESVARVWLRALLVSSVTVRARTMNHFFAFVALMAASVSVAEAAAARNSSAEQRSGSEKN